MNVKPIGRIITDFPENFGLPRQSGLIEELTGKIVFDKEFDVPDAFRGLEEYSHIWLLWQLDECEWKPTVRPPRLGGNAKVGVFASRSPFRPNSIGMSVVRLDRVEYSEEGVILHVAGVDMRSGTPILDIKPYVAISDRIESPMCGYSDRVKDNNLEVDASEAILAALPADKQQALIKLLAQNPAPHYQADPDRIYGFAFAGREVKFRINGNTAVLLSIE